MSTYRDIYADTASNVEDIVMFQFFNSLRQRENANSRGLCRKSGKKEKPEEKGHNVTEPQRKRVFHVASQRAETMKRWRIMYRRLSNLRRTR
jgi:hypothetical protein